MRRSTLILLAPVLAFAGQSGIANADDIFCSRYAKHASSQVSMNEQMGCGFTGARWSTDEKFHFDRCMDDLRANITNPAGYQAAKQHFDQEDRQRIADVIACREQKAAAAPAPAPTGGGSTRTVSENTDLYDAREGKKIGGESDFLAVGQQVTTVGQCGTDWCQLSDPKGWVWGGHLK